MRVSIQTVTRALRNRADHDTPHGYVQKNARHPIWTPGAFSGKRSGQAEGSGSGSNPPSDELFLGLVLGIAVTLAALP